MTKISKQVRRVTFPPCNNINDDVVDSQNSRQSGSFSIVFGRYVYIIKARIDRLTLNCPLEHEITLNSFLAYLQIFDFYFFSSAVEPSAQSHEKILYNGDH